MRLWALDHGHLVLSLSCYPGPVFANCLPSPSRLVSSVFESLGLSILLLLARAGVRVEQDGCRTVHGITNNPTACTARSPCHPLLARVRNDHRAVLRLRRGLQGRHACLEQHRRCVGAREDSREPRRTDAQSPRLEQQEQGHPWYVSGVPIPCSERSRCVLLSVVVPIVPSRDWSSPHANIPDPQEPEAERKPSLLGLSMRVCEPEFAMDNVWHVLDVLEGSPAESAGLVPYGDWIIGWSGGVLSAEGDFYDVVEAVRPFHVRHVRMVLTTYRTDPCSISKNRYASTSILTTSSTCPLHPIVSAV